MTTMMSATDHAAMLAALSQGLARACRVHEE
eukprot:CAMPEP_0197603216 /NCGR_PEP_ID=MMETSP1326-20131121/38778_1 /TAXON_ID=1155430 /ORGANISM="Genus nov. species nov., Strain RCC2288" /LENGTH=30 /DNA_ID= /DNA_START= /DNA_END= /DNA_ORIENTATION=